MTQYEFDNILEKYLAGKCTPEEEEVVVKWYDRVDHKQNEVLEESKKAGLSVQLWKKIQYSTTLKKNRLRTYWIRSGAVAASILLLWWAGWLVIAEPTQVKISVPIITASDIEVKNNSTKPQEINLEDGSLVTLHPQSTLSYADDFGKAARTVYLQGTGFFKVKRDTSKPFRVHTGNLVTEVLGTSFYIKNQKNSNTIEVEVASGKVSVYENTQQGKEKKGKKILTQNQKVTFRADTKQLVSSIVEQPIISTQKPLNEPLAEFIFEDATLEFIFSQLEKMYLLEIVTENGDLNQCVFTGDLNGLPLFTQLDLVCKSVEAHYEVKETQIFIKGKGCTNPSFE